METEADLVTGFTEAQQRDKSTGSTLYASPSQGKGNLGQRKSRRNICTLKNP